MLLAKKKKSLKIVEYPLHQLIRLGCLEIHITLLNRNIDVRILAQGYISLPLFWTWHWRKIKYTKSC